MKRYNFLVLFLVLITSFQASAFATSAPSSFTFKGSGFGHGVGMSQIGAKGQALEGKTATQILKYYFPGADVVPVVDTQTIRVNIGHQLTSVSFAQAPAGIFQLTGDTNTSQAIESRSTLSFQIVGKAIAATSKNASKATSDLGTASLWNMQWSLGTDYVMEKFDGNTFKVNHGYLELRAVSVKGLGYRIEVTNSIRLHDEYLDGISEVPSSWPEAALESQIIASRTYALSRLGVLRRDCDCHVYNSKYDQNFSGYLKESEIKYGSIWKSAVAQTFSSDSQGLAITFNGQPITVYFFSSSGGITQRAVDVWGTDIPYLSSVPDPWSLNPKLNPKYASWVRVVDQKTMASAFNLSDVTRYAIAKRSATGSALSITGYSSNGERKTIPIGTFKVAVKLPSSWFGIPASVLLPDTTTSN